MFENKTQMSLDLQVEFNIFHSKKAKIILYTILGILWFIAGLLFFLGDTTLEAAVGIAIWVSFVFVIIVLYIRRRTNTKSRLKKLFIKNPTLDENVIVNFVFNENDFNCTGFRFNDQISCTTLKYEYLLKIVESKNNLYFYTNPIQAFLLDGNNMTNGNFTDLKNFLKSKIGFKYVNKNKENKKTSS